MFYYCFNCLHHSTVLPRCMSRTCGKMIQTLQVHSIQRPKKVVVLPGQPQSCTTSAIFNVTYEEPEYISSLAVVFGKVRIDSFLTSRYWALNILVFVCLPMRPCVQ